MTRSTQRPNREPGGRNDDYLETHPAYAVIGASRVDTHPGRTLFGSDFLHSGYVKIRIGAAHLRRAGLTALGAGEPIELQIEPPKSVS